MTIFGPDSDKVSPVGDDANDGFEGQIQRPTSCDHQNPICICNTSDSERANLLKQYLDVLVENGWTNVMLMPLNEEGKGPIIEGRCHLDTDEAKSFLVKGEKAVGCIEKDGRRGFCLYAGKPEHGTDGLVFTDHDDPDRFPADSDTLTVASGSGTGYHQTFRNSGDVRNAKGKGELNKAGEVRAYNWYVILPGSIHPSGGIYHTISNSGVGNLEPDDLPEEFCPSNGTPVTENSEAVELDSEVPDSLGDIEADFGVESRYQTMLQAENSETTVAIIRGNLRKAGFPDDRHEAEGWLAEEVGFYMDRDREVIEQVLRKIFTDNPETDAHLDNPEKSSERKYLQDAHHREQIIDYATSKISKYDPGLGIGKFTREERPEVGYPLIIRVGDALSDLILARTVEIMEHPRIDRGQRQVQNALRKMQDSDESPINLNSVRDGRERYYYLESHSVLIPKARRDELGIEVGL